MKYAVAYNPSFRHLNEVDEIIFPEWDKIKEDISIITNKVKPEQKVIINLDWYGLEAEDAIPYLNKLKQEHSNLLVQIHSKQNDFIQILQDNEINFMFTNICANYESVYGAIEKGAEELYIAEDLGFDLEELQKIRIKYNVKFRVFPDVGQTDQDFKNAIPALTKFWIRPEDTELYENYVDVFEFYTRGDRLSVIYEIYSKRQWKGEIGQLITDCDLKIDNTTIAPYFARHRLSCRRKCLVDKGYCNMCFQIENLAEHFAAAGVTIHQPAFKKELTEEQKKELLKQLKTFGEKVEEQE